MIFVDYDVAENCENPDSYGMVCVKCGKCGRKFCGGLLRFEKTEKDIKSRKKRNKEK